MSYRGSVKMFGVQGLVLCLGVCALFFSGCQAIPSYSSYPPVYVWPLGDTVVGIELNIHVQECGSSNLDYDAGPDTLDYNATEFVLEDSSYVDIPIANEPRLDGDIAFSFHLYPIIDGTFFHYKSDNATYMGLTEVEIKIDSGAFVTSLSTNYGHSLNRTTHVYFSYGAWIRVIVERDLSSDYLTIRFDPPSINLYTTFDSWLSNTKLIFPGKLRLGGSQDGGSFFTGRLACLQLVDTKDPDTASEYDAECMKVNWPTTSTIASTVPATCGAVTTSTTTSTITASTQTSTSTSPSTFSTTSTPSSTTQTTTSLPTTTTTTSTSTTPITTSTTTMPSATTQTASTTTPPIATPTPTFATPTTATIMFQATTSTPATATIPTQAPPTWPSFVPAISSMNMGCSHFAATPGATYQSPGDVLQTVALDLRECVWLCVRDGGCGSFVHSGGVCQTGVTSPSLIGDAGKTMYVLQ